MQVQALPVPQPNQSKEVYAVYLALDGGQTLNGILGPVVMQPLNRPCQS